MIASSLVKTSFLKNSLLITYFIYKKPKSLASELTLTSMLDWDKLGLSGWPFKKEKFSCKKVCSFMAASDIVTIQLLEFALEI